MFDIEKICSTNHYIFGFPWQAKLLRLLEAYCHKSIKNINVNAVFREMFDIDKCATTVVLFKT